MTERYRYDSALEKVYDDETFNGESTENYGVFECCEIMNEQHEQIERLKRNLKALDELKCEIAEENEQLKRVIGKSVIERLLDFEESYKDLEKENEQLKQSMKEVAELLSDEVDVFSDEAIEHDINAYMELKELDNKDAFYMAKATKTAIKMLKGDDGNA